jgi:hypothetical protein
VSRASRFTRAGLEAEPCRFLLSFLKPSDKNASMAKFSEGLARATLRRGRAVGWEEECERGVACGLLLWH